nr:transposase [Propionibacterium sp.]
MRAVYRLLGLVRRYGNGPVEAACSRALDLDVVSVTKIASMLERATEDTLPLLPTGTTPGGRFARQPAEFATRPTASARDRTGPAAIQATTPASHRTTAAGGPVATLTLVRDDGPDTLFEQEHR